MSTAIIKSLPIIQYPAAIESEIDQLSMALATIPGLAVYPPRWLAIQLLSLIHIYMCGKVAQAMPSRCVSTATAGP